MQVKFTQNAYEFALAKASTFFEKSKDLSKNEAKALFEKMERHSETEKVQFALAIQAAQEWQEILKDKDIFPNLEYRAVMDENTREKHARLNGIIRPIEDSFWQTYFRPIDYRCRCTIRQHDKKVKITEKLPENLPEPPKGLRHNPGISGKAFDFEHPYFEYTSKEALKNINEYAGYGKEFIKQGFNIKTNAYTVSHTKHGKNEIKDNLSVAKFLNQEKINVILLPIEDNKTLKDIIPENQHKKGKFPDAYLPNLDIVIDFKRIESNSYNAIDKAIRSGKNQADYVLLDIKSKIKNGILKNAIKDRVARTSNLKEVWIILEGKIYQLKRKDIIKNIFPF